VNECYFSLREKAAATRPQRLSVALAGAANTAHPN